MDSTLSPTVKITKGKKVGARSLAHSTSGVEGRVGALGWTRKIDKQFNYSHEVVQTKQLVG